MADLLQKSVRAGRQSSAQRHLLARFPQLAERLPWLPLANLPSPVARLEQLGAARGATQLWVKPDDQNSELYSGNKVRKLELILGHARQQGYRRVLTMGAVGSNHAAATSLFCRELGFEPVLALIPQPVLSYVRQNILVNHACGARYIFAPNEVACVAGVARFVLTARARRQPPPYLVYFGGSLCPGGVGFVEAGLELAEQVRAGKLPEPKYVFVATGSCGTHAGLMVGLRLAGLSTEVVGVRIVSKAVTNRWVVAWHANRTARFLRRRDPAFPRLRFRASEVRLLDGFYGGQYGRPTAEAKRAIALLGETEGLKLDPTYTAKAFAGMMHAIEQQGLRRKPVLFWQTLNGVDLSQRIADICPDELPAPLRRYFSEPLYDPEL